MEYGTRRLRPERPEKSKPNRTGIPIQMKWAFERKCGLPFDDVRVHYNSAFPAKLGALAYTQGTHVYLGPGQERHLRHELGHVIQQKRGQVQATETLHGIKVNTSSRLEQNADLLAGQRAQNTTDTAAKSSAPCDVVQMVRYSNIDTMWRGITDDAVTAGTVDQIIQLDSVLQTFYNDATIPLAHCDFIKGATDVNNIQIEPVNPGDYKLSYCPYPTDPLEQQVFVAYIIHELGHAAVAEQYQTNIDSKAVGPNTVWLNFNLPADTGAKIANPQFLLMPGSGMTLMQWDCYKAQADVLNENMKHLNSVIESDKKIAKKPQLRTHLLGRVAYSLFSTGAEFHYDTVLCDMMYILIANDLLHTDTYKMVREMLQDANSRRHQSSGETLYSPRPADTPPRSHCIIM